MSTEIEPIDASDEPGSTRRSMLTKGAMAAAVATVAGLAMSKEVSAANGGPLLIGAANTGTLNTTLTGGSSLQVGNGTTASFKSSIYGTTSLVDGVGVTGENSNPLVLNGTGVFGRNVSQQGFGVYGVTLNTGVGVYGEHDGSTVVGTGVYGKSNAGAGVIGEGTNFDFQAVGSGQLNLTANIVATIPGSTLGVRSLGADAAGDLYWRSSSTTIQKLNHPPAATFHPISPARVYDSRSATPTPGKLPVGAPRLVSIKDGRDPNTGAVTAADVVPAGTTAVFFNLTVTQTENSGYLSVVPGDATEQSGSSINWSSTGLDLANGLIGKVGPNRDVKVFAGGGGTTHFVIDVTGYFL